LTARTTQQLHYHHHQQQERRERSTRKNPSKTTEGEGRREGGRMSKTDAGCTLALFLFLHPLPFSDQQRPAVKARRMESRRKNTQKEEKERTYNNRRIKDKGFKKQTYTHKREGKKKHLNWKQASNNIKNENKKPSLFLVFASFFPTLIFQKLTCRGRPSLIYLLAQRASLIRLLSLLFFCLIFILRRVGAHVLSAASRLLLLLILLYTTFSSFP
jgi:hypothetical protein